MVPTRDKTPAMTEWEQRNRKDLREEMIALLRAGLSQPQMGRVLGVNQSTVNRWMKQLEIPARRSVWVVPEVA